jgi:AmmeMemoRadiSam system protein B
VSASTRERHPAVAGTFYPADPDVLRATVDDALAVASATLAPDGPPPKALIVPHAGYVYSGPVAASAYARLAPIADAIERVVLLGPAHRVAVHGLALPAVDRFATPLGSVDLDVEGRARIARHARVVVDDRPHAEEHSLEVHLPFLQRVLPGSWMLLPILVGDAAPDEVAAVIDEVWGGPETLIVVSSDLSHYLDYETARRCDERTAAAIVARRSTELRPTDACGARPVAGLLESARHHDLHVDLLDLRSSGDTAGPRDRVVGYGAFALA